MVNITLAIIKPDAVADGHQGKIIDRILQAGFKVRAARIMHLTSSQAESFYAVHQERPFFRELTEFMSSGPIMPLVLEKTNAVEDFRNLIGATDPIEADPGTIRKDFARNKGENAVHGSDSDKNAQKEVAFFFTEADILGSF